ncbi:MAG: KUP/HAK/KT family potassium transporter, partial [Deltaproteobacteria bacterium]|nr:KUP/HAK/KT family potassium transporter [Deltaproteobacteria bacterium]
PVVGLATAATVIASQALISGCFSLTHQAVQLGLLPRIVTKHTSENEQGQIYIPTINWLMLLGTLWLVSTFKSSANLTAAYGIAVAGTMVITSILFYFVAYSRWHWPWWTVSFLTFVFLIIDFSFLSANFPKIIHGGWFALLVAGVISGLILTWRRGTQILAERMSERSISYEKFMKDIQEHPPVRIPGTAVYLTGTDEGVSQALIHNLRHNRVLNENVVSVTVRTAPVAHIHPDKHLQVTKLESGFYTVIIYYGFMDRPNIPMALELAKDLGLDCELLNVAYFIGRRTLLATDRPGMAIWREQLFAMMAKNAQNSGVFFKIPPDRVIEIGYQVEL